MPTNYREFEIEVGPAGSGGYALTARGPGGDARGTLPQLDSDAELQQLLARLANLDTDEDLLGALGARLFAALFTGEIAKVYAASRSRLADSEGLTIRLNIPPEHEEVAALPWEFLTDPDIGPLAIFDTPVVRYLPQPTPLPTFPVTLPLKVLLTGAQPKGLPQAEVAAELAVVEKALGALGDNVQVHVEPHLTADRLSEHLLDTVHIWHFVGHGSFDGKSARLVFEDSSGDADALDARTLSAMLYRRVRLVVLDACDTGKMATDPFRSLAPALIRAQVPAVIAQQFQVPEATTRAFVTGFYRALARGFPLDACVTEGRKAVMRSSSAGQPDWGIPVVYSRVEDGRLFDLPAVLPAAAPPAAQAAPAAPAAPAPAPAAPAGPEAELVAQIEAARRERRMLRHRANLYGGNPPLHIDARFGELGKEIEKLYRQLGRLKK